MAKAQKRRAGGALDQQKEVSTGVVEGGPDGPPRLPDKFERLRSYDSYDAATNPEAEALVRLGCKVFKLPMKAKQAKGDWPNAGIDDPDKARSVFKPEDNIGVLLGAPSGMLADVDCDCPEAIALASTFLPASMVVFGRKSKPRSHWICRTPTHAGEEKTAAIAFKDISPGKKKAANLLELRVGNAVEGDARSAYTMFPGSYNGSEAVAWDPERPAEIPVMAADDLRERVHKLAAATLLVRHWPKQPEAGESGTRHLAARALTGFLHRCAGWNEHDIKHFIGAVARLAGDEEWKSRVKTTPSDDIATPVAGRQALADQFGKAVATLVQKWLCQTDRHSEEIEEHPWLVEQLAKNSVVILGGKTLITRWKKFRLHGDSDHEVFEPWAKKEFQIFNENQFVMRTGPMGGEQKVFLSNIFLERAKRYYDIVFEPMQKVEEGVLNLWPPERGFGVKATPGSCDLFKKHLFEVIANGDQETHDYVLKWCAWAVQNPHRPAEVALVFRGGRGAGKGLFARAMCRIFGAFSYHAAGSKALTSEHNGHLVQTAMLFADEAFWAGDKIGEQLLKRMLTEDTLEIHPKFVGKFLVKNCLHIIMVSNNDWVVPAGHDERRFAVFDVSHKQAGKTTPATKAYFDPLYAELTNGGLDAFLHELLAMDLGAWHPRDDIPETEALRQQKEASMPPADLLVEALINQGFLPGSNRANPRIAATHANPQNPSEDLWAEAKRILGWKCPSPEALGKALHREWGLQDGRHRRKCFFTGESRPVSGKKFPPLHELRKKFEGKYGKWEWHRPAQKDWAPEEPALTENDDGNVVPEAKLAEHRKKRQRAKKPEADAIPF